MPKQRAEVMRKQTVEKKNRWREQEVRGTQLKEGRTSRLCGNYDET